MDGTSRAPVRSAYVGFQLIDDPPVDLGFDLSAEYAEARRLHGTK